MPWMNPLLVRKLGIDQCVPQFTVIHAANVEEFSIDFLPFFMFLYIAQVLKFCLSYFLSNDFILN